jgi:hypothetical protein
VVVGQLVDDLPALGVADPQAGVGRPGRHPVAVGFALTVH